MLELEELKCGHSSLFFERFCSLKLQTNRLASFELMLQCACALAEDCWKGDALSVGAAMLGLEDLEYGRSSSILERFCSLKLQSNWLASVDDAAVRLNTGKRLLEGRCVISRHYHAGVRTPSTKRSFFIVF